MRKKLISGILKTSMIVDMNGMSVGESPHVTFQILFPIAREIYVTDNIFNLKEDLSEALFNARYIDNKYGYDIEQNDTLIDIYRKEEVYV